MRLIGDGSSFTQTVNKAKQEAGGLSGHMGKQFSAIKGMVAGAFGVSALIGFVKTVFDFGGQMVDLSQKFGISTSSVQKFNYAAEQSGISVETALGSYQKMNVAISKAMHGDEKSLAAFESMGISIDDLKSKSPEQIFMMIGDAVNSMPHTPDMLVNMMKLLGKGASDVIPMFRAGLAGMFQDAEEGNMIVSDDDLKKIEEVGDEFAKIWLIIKAGGATVIGGLLDVAEGIYYVIEPFITLTNFIRDMFVDMFAVLPTLFSDGFGAAFESLGTALEQLFNKLMKKVFGEGILGDIARSITGADSGAKKPAGKKKKGGAGAAGMGDDGESEEGEEEDSDPKKREKSAKELAKVNKEIAEMEAKRGSGDEKRVRGEERLSAAESKLLDQEMASVFGFNDEQKLAEAKLEVMKAEDALATDKERLEKLREQNTDSENKLLPLSQQIELQKIEALKAQQRLDDARLGELFGEDTAEAQAEAERDVLKENAELAAMKKKTADGTGMLAGESDALAKIGGTRGGANPLASLSAQQLATLQSILEATNKGNANTAVLNP